MGIRVRKMVAVGRTVVVYRVYGCLQVIGNKFRCPRDARLRSNVFAEE